MRNFIASQGIPQKKLDDPQYVFARINPADLRLAIKQQMQNEENRSHFFLLSILIVLAEERCNEQSYSTMKALPWELVCHIVSFAEIPFKKTQQEKYLLACEVDLQFSEITTLLKNPGGNISVVQKGSQQQFTFTFFKSARKICSEYSILKTQLLKEQTRKHPITDKITGKKFTQTSENILRSFKNNKKMILNKSSLQENIECDIVDGHSLYANKL